MKLFGGAQNLFTYQGCLPDIILNFQINMVVAIANYLQILYSIHLKSWIKSYQA